MRIVIIGGGFGGLNAAVWLGDKLQNTQHEVILIADQPDFVFRPSLIWLPFNQRQIEQISFPLHPTLEKAGVQFIHNKVAKVMPIENRVVLEKDTIEYDYLIIATGGIPDWERIPGLKGNSASIFCASDALQTKERVASLQPDQPIVIGVAQENLSPFMAYEFTFELEDYLHQRGIQAPITFFTYENKLLDHTGKKSTNILQKHMEEKQIPYYCNVQVEKVESSCVKLSNGVTYPFALSLILPPYRGADYIFNSPDLDHDRGLINVQRSLQVNEWDNIYAIGDTISWKEPMFRSGRAAELQGHVAAENIYRKIQGNTDHKEFQGSILGDWELGSDGGVFIIKYPSSKNTSSLLEWSIDGVIPHLMKVAFEKYYIWKFS